VFLLANLCTEWDQVAVVMNAKEDFSYALSESDFLMVAREFDKWVSDPGRMFTHEFGHSFGGLKDEYPDREANSDVDAPNCDVVGCPKWCSGSYPEPYETECSSIEDEDVCEGMSNCIWLSEIHPHFQTQCIEFRGDTDIGTDCIEGAGCYFNCHGTNGWQSSITSIMNDDPDAEHFNAVSYNHLVELLNNYE